MSLTKLKAVYIFYELREKKKHNRTLYFILATVQRH